MMPALEMSPRVGRTLKRLFALAGLRRELTVSVPGVVSPKVFNTGSWRHLYPCQILQSLSRWQHQFHHCFHQVSWYDHKDLLSARQETIQRALREPTHAD